MRHRGSRRFIHGVDHDHFGSRLRRALTVQEGDGKLTAAVGICAGLLALVGLSNGARGKVRGATVLSAVGIAISTFEWQHVSSKIRRCANTR